jgi:hypothetical protein
MTPVAAEQGGICAVGQARPRSSSSVSRTPQRRGKELAFGLGLYDEGCPSKRITSKRDFVSPG